ncbi:MAG: S41 family peptidase, partial [Defluviitaleaceae bacterium]|nr:S41 family peptidase [Defluviitaleaceae bacterium]
GADYDGEGEYVAATTPPIIDVMPDDMGEWLAAAYDAFNPFHQDLTSLQNMMVENFAMWDLAYREQGIDLDDIFANIRAYINDNPGMDEAGFEAALRRYFAPMMTWPDVFAGFRLTRMFQQRQDDAPEPETVDIEGIYDAVLLQLIAVLSGVSGEAISEMAYEIEIMMRVLRIDKDLDEFIYAMEGSDIIAAAKWMQALSAIQNQKFIENIQTEIIEDGRIALLTPAHFMRAHGFSQIWNEQIQDFFEQIQGYEHLILDFRYLAGGPVDFFIDSIMALIITEPMAAYAFQFMVLGDYAVPFTQRLILPGPQIPLRATDRNIRPIHEILAAHDLYEFYLPDANRLQYGFRSELRVNPAPLARFDGNPAFDGKIWILIGQHTFDGGAIAAWIARETGFATVVGEPAPFHAMIAPTSTRLRNSAIMVFMDIFYATDSAGRPLASGIVPNYPSRPGMTALETVLDMINQ